MSLTIATKTRRFTVKLEEVECEQLFDQLLAGMLKGKQKEEVEQHVTKEDITCKEKECSKEESVSSYKAKGF